MKKGSKADQLSTLEIRDVVLTFYRAIVSDFRCSFDSYGKDEAHDDQRYLVRRVNSEGEAFPLSVMPSLGRALNKALVTGSLVVPSSLRVTKDTALPRLFHTIWLLVFDRDGEMLAPDNPADRLAQRIAIRSLRQVCLAFSKVEHTSSTQNINDSIDAFVARTSADAYLDTLYGMFETSHACPDNICTAMVLDKKRSAMVAQASRLVDHLFKHGNVWDRICPLTQGPEFHYSGTSGNTGRERSMKE